jgi:hypothetical protein
MKTPGRHSQEAEEEAEEEEAEESALISWAVRCIALRPLCAHDHSSTNPVHPSLLLLLRSSMTSQTMTEWCAMPLRFRGEASQPASCAATSGQIYRQADRRDRQTLKERTQLHTSLQMQSKQNHANQSYKSIQSNQIKSATPPSPIKDTSQPKPSRKKKGPFYNPPISPSFLLAWSRSP